MVVIEIIRIIMRAFSISFRLMANMRAGNLMLGIIRAVLVRACVDPLSVKFFSVLLLEALFIMFEVWMCVFQAYVFVLILGMYTEEYNIK